NYKSFDFSMFWQGVAGNIVNNQWKSYSDFWNVWVQNGFNHPSRLLNAWSPTNTNSTIPALSLNNANDELRTSTYFMESGSYLKMRNLQIGYTLPKKILSSTGMERLHIYLLAQNLVSLKKSTGSNAFTGPDPESPGGSAYSNPYVRPQTFKVGIEL
ncbi:MAG TPA: TonB-dependent receptor, partial [Flavisolibacter sp.]|nr:TonB-dependent receptor [Flavisolibacter sp.]